MSTHSDPRTPEQQAEGRALMEGIRLSQEHVEASMVVTMGERGQLHAEIASTGLTPAQRTAWLVWGASEAAAIALSAAETSEAGRWPQDE